MEFINTCFETTNEVRALAGYSHLLPAISALILGGFAFRFARNKTKAILFFSFTCLLALWLIGDTIVWTTNNYNAVAAFWSPLDFINILFFLFILCFAVVDFSSTKRLPLFVLIPVIIAATFPFFITVMGKAVLEFDEPNCEMIGNELLAQYKLGVEWVVIFSILIAAAYAIIRKWRNKNEVKRIGVIAFATVGFLAIFSSTEFISTLTNIFEINLYALFTLPVFILILTYTIIEQNTFNITTDSVWFVRLLFVIFIIVGVSNLFLADDPLEFFTTLASAIVTFGFGLLVLRSAHREAKQRHKIEQLAKKLESANKRLKTLDQLKSEFLSIASHQLRSPLTAIRGYASMLQEGSFGKMPKKAMEAVERIAESSRFMASSVEDYLNVSRIEAGHMKYNLEKFNVRNLTEEIVDDMRQYGVKKGLLLTFSDKELECDGVVKADKGKVQQILHNLIDNALKYTVKGSVKVIVRNQRKKLYVDVVDTGIGMNEETIEQLFEKFERAKNANTVNVSGTGLGLYVAKKMAEDMGGTVSATSEGDGKGSTFTLELPLVS